MNRYPRLGIFILLAATLALLLAGRLPAQAEGEKPVKSVTGALLKLVPKALEGDDKAAQKLTALGPVERRAAEETEKRLLRKWRFKSLKSGRHNLQFEVGGQTAGLHAGGAQALHVQAVVAAHHLAPRRRGQRQRRDRLHLEPPPLGLEGVDRRPLGRAARSAVVSRSRSRSCSA